MSTRRLRIVGNHVQSTTNTRIAQTPIALGLMDAVCVPGSLGLQGPSDSPI